MKHSVPVREGFVPDKNSRYATSLASTSIDDANIFFRDWLLSPPPYSSPNPSLPPLPPPLLFFLLLFSSFLRSAIDPTVVWEVPDEGSVSFSAHPQTLLSPDDVPRCSGRLPSLGPCHSYRWIELLAPKPFFPQWGAAVAEIKVPSVENTELKGSPFKAWSRSVCSLHATLTARDFYLVHFYSSGPFTCIFPQKPPVLAVANTGSFIGRQNKIGHLAHH